MQNPLSQYKLLARRWAWLVVLGIVFCSGTTFVVSKLIHPVYLASASIVINIKTSNSAYDNFTISELAVPTFAQLLTNPAVLSPVAAEHPGMTLPELNSMMTVKPQSNTLLIELDITNNDPQLAKQLAYEIGQSLMAYSETQSPGAVQVLPIDLPTQPIYPKPLANAGLGAVAGLGFAIALIILFEWIEDHLARPEEVRELLGQKILTIVPRLSRKQYSRPPVEIPALAERYRVLSANLIAVQEVKPFKLVMVTSAVANEGKSTIAANLASFLAMAGRQVLLVDANLHHPVLDQLFKLDNHVGLSTVFLDMWASPRVELYGQPTNISTLHVLTAGKVPSESPEMLQSPLANQLFEYFKHTPFDYIIFDAPPLLPVADAQILASLVEAIVLVVGADKTSRRVLRRVRSVLDDLHNTILGVAINKSPWTDDRTIRQYANHIWQPQKGNIMSQNIAPPLDTASSPDTQRLSVKDRPLKPPRSLIHTPAPTNGAVYADTAIISDSQQAVMPNHSEMDTRNMIQEYNNEKIS